jgi:hypothetical protein
MFLLSFKIQHSISHFNSSSWEHTSSLVLLLINSNMLNIIEVFETTQYYSEFLRCQINWFRCQIVMSCRLFSRSPWLSLLDAKSNDVSWTSKIWSYFTHRHDSSIDLDSNLFSWFGELEVHSHPRCQKVLFLLGSKRISAHWRQPRTPSTPVIAIEDGLGETPGECHSQPYLDSDNQEKV